GPALLETSNLHVPDRIPIGVVLAVVGNLAVASAAKRVDREEGAVSPVVERVEDKADVVIAREDGGVVATHLGGHQPLGVAFPAPEGDIHLITVKEEPDLRFLGGRGAFLRILLDEIRHRWNARVNFFIEHSIELKRGGETHSTNGDTA